MTVNIFIHEIENIRTYIALVNIKPLGTAILPHNYAHCMRSSRCIMYMIE